MNKSMVEIQDYSQQLKTGADNLNNQLTSVKGGIYNTIDNSCPGPLTADCTTIRNTVNSIDIKPNFDMVRKDTVFVLH